MDGVLLGRVENGLQRKILHLLPRRAIVPDGIGDYATLLAEEMSVRSGLDALFLQCAPASDPTPRSDRWLTCALQERNADRLDRIMTELVALHRPMGVIVHVSLYGYEKRGVPLWFSDGLERWKRLHRHIPLLAIFHELWASGGANALTSSFWLWPLQRTIIGRLAGLADALIATTQDYARRLSSVCPSGSETLATLNVFSNVGEPADIPAFGQRRRRLVIFSGRGVAQLATENRRGLCDALRLTDAEEIVEIGARKEPAPANVFGVPVIARGLLAPSAVSDLLLDARFGLTPYNNRLVFGKSTVFAAYAAHGVVPVSLGVTHENSDGLLSGEHYLVTQPQGGEKTDFGAIQERLYAWYQRHALAAEAQYVGRIIDALAARNR